MITLTKPVPADRSKIDVHNPDHFKTWAKRMQISADELLKVVEKVGNNAGEVRKDLATSGR